MSSSTKRQCDRARRAPRAELEQVHLGRRRQKSFRRALSKFVYPTARAQAGLDHRVAALLEAEGDEGHAPGEESTLLYVLSHPTPHTNLHINKSTEA